MIKPGTYRNKNAVRLFVRVAGSMLGKAQLVADANSILALGDPTPMVFDHRDVTAYPLHNLEDHFVIEEEVENELVLDEMALGSEYDQKLGAEALGGNHVSGQLVTVYELARPANPFVEYDKRHIRSYHLDYETARQSTFHLNGRKGAHLSTIQRREAIRLEDGRYLLLDLHHHIFEVTPVPPSLTATEAV